MKIRGELTEIFQLSYKATIRHLKNFGVPVNTKSKFVNMEELKAYHPRLFYSIALTQTKRVKKPFFYIRDLMKILNKTTHSTVWRWIYRNDIPVVRCGNKFVLFAFDLIK